MFLWEGQSVKRKIIPYNPLLRNRARILRRHGTKSEALLWNLLKGHQRQGFDFHRQRPIDHFIVDFFCSELMLAIEIDGITHNEKIQQDKTRQLRLESLGVSFLRFLDADVRNNIEGVILAIDAWIAEHTPSSLACD